MNTDNDLEIVNRILNGQPADFALLVDRYSNRIHKYLFTKSQNRNDIEDILQETFLKAFINLNSYKIEYQFSTWLYTIAFHELCRAADKNKRQNVLRLDDIGVVEASASEIKLGIWEEASKLSSVFYTVLWLRYHEELEVKEIAYIMKSSIALVKINLFRARNQLKKRIEAESKMMTRNQKNKTLLSQGSL